MLLLDNFQMMTVKQLQEQIDTYERQLGKPLTGFSISVETKLQWAKEELARRK